MSLRNILPRLALAAALILSVTASVQAQVVVYMKSGGEPKRGTNIRYSDTGQNYMLTINSIEIAVPAATVDYVDLPKPKALDEAEKRMEAGQDAAAIPTLQKIADDYAMLTWDITARELLVVAYAKTGDSAKAMSAYRELIRKSAGGQISAQARMTYWKLMMDGGKLTEVAAELDGVIATGSREEAASAQLTRGNIRKAQNKTQDALMDYLRTALLFEDVVAVQPEALFKAAEMLDTLRDPRAPELRDRLMKKYPESEYAKKAGEM